MLKNLIFNVEDEKKQLEFLITNGLKTKEFVSRRKRLHARDTYCSRRNAILATNEGEAETDMLFELYTEIGKTVEDIILKGLKNSKALIYRDYVLPVFGANLGGRIDAIIHVDSQIRILEIKSIGELPITPKNSHLAQTKTYAAVCGLPYSILYLSRKIQRFENYQQTPDMCVFNYDFDRTELKAHMFEVLKSNEYLNRDLLPPKLHRFKNQCEYCDFTKFCFDGVPDARLSKLNLPTPEEELDILTVVTKQCDEIMDQNHIKDRRNGVLTHIQNSNANAKRILTKLNWDEATGA